MKELWSVFFVSRNKDNKNVEGFVERKLPFLTSNTGNELTNKFTAFAKEGVRGEISRFYMSVNTRDRERIYRELLHYLIDNPDIAIESIEGKVASIASRGGCRETKKFLLDCDVEVDELEDIMEYLKSVEGVEIYDVYKTPNGFGVITSGFDTRELLKNHPNVELKRDGYKFICMQSSV